MDAQKLTLAGQIAQKARADEQKALQEGINKLNAEQVTLGLKRVEAQIREVWLVLCAACLIMCCVGRRERSVQRGSNRRCRTPCCRCSRVEGPRLLACEGEGAAGREEGAA